MKKHIFILLFSCVALSSLAQQPLQKEKNLFRHGDHLIKQQVEYKDPGRSGSKVFWNFSNLYIHDDEYEVYSEFHSDSTIIVREHRTLYEYKLHEDSLFLIGFQNPITRIEYPEPELQLIYPFEYQSKFRKEFYAAGRYSQESHLEMTGYLETIADGVGVLILPNKDTIHNVTRVYTEKYFIERKSPIGETLKLASGIPRNLAIQENLLEDTLIYKLDTYKWYADGYRYPLFEVIEAFISQESQMSHYFKTSFFYPPHSHTYLKNDSINCNLLDGEENPSIKIPEDLTEDMPDNGKIASIVYNYYPNPAIRELILEIFIPYTTSLQLILTDMQGRTLSHHTMEAEKGTIITHSLDISSYPKGNYILQIRTSEEVFIEKIIKQ